MVPRIVMTGACVLSCLLLIAAAPQDTKDSKDDAAKAQKAREEKEAKERDRALKRASLERELPIAKERLARAQRDLEDAAIDAQGARAKLDKELELARMKLDTFRTRQMPARVAKATLDLQGSKDSFDNATEELQQLEIMYKEQDLADTTRDIVLKRARRDLVRAQARLELAQSEHDTLVQQTLPQEMQKLELDVAEKQREIERGERAAHRTAMEKRISVMTAEAEIKKIETEAASLQEGAK